MRNAGGALPARHILGNYELFEEIGRGGMGIVYRALDLSLDRVVAVKILRDDLRAHQSIVTRFSREAQAAARLDHDNIVQIYAVGTVDRTPYIAMEYIDGFPLSALMQREHRLEWKLALEIGRQIATALACAHDRHVIHRDVKPPNILLDDKNRAYVTDFGIAKILTLDDNLTVDGTRLGTPHYMAPERCKTGEVTAASDLYSLGVLLFQMLTGRLPYEASTPVEMIQRITTEPPARVRRFVAEVPEDVERLVAWLMEMNPKHRPADGQVVCDAIDRVMAGKALDANENKTTEVIEDFRRSLVKNKEAETRHLGDSPNVVNRRSLFLFGVIAAAVCVAGWVLYALKGHSATTIAANIPTVGDTAKWFESADVASFSDEGDNVALAQLAFPGYTVNSVAFSGEGAVGLAVLEQPATHKRVLCALEPDDRRASLRLVAPSTVQMELTATVRAAGVRPFGLLRWADKAAYVNFDANGVKEIESVGTPLSAAALHPSGKTVAAGLMVGTGCSLVSFAGDALHGTPTQIVPAGARINHIQYSRDGQTIAYLREIANGASALRVVPAGGVADGPAPLREGILSVQPNAFNATGTAILVTETESGTSVARAVSTTDGSVVRELGAACGAAWGLLESTVVLSAPDRKGALQLWTVDYDNPAQRTQRTFVDGGVSADVSISADGKWAMARANTTGKPGVIFVKIGA